MNKEKVSKVEADEEILTSDVPDDVLERAASAEQNAFTMLYCTNEWYSCGLPQMIAFYRNSSGSLAMFAATRRASSFLTNFAADYRRGKRSSKYYA